MKIEILTTLKGSAIWRKGTVFDDAVSPIPGDILKMVDNPTVKVIATEKPIVAVEPITETIETVAAGLIPEQNREEPEPPQEKTSEPTFPELEGLIKEHTSIKAVADLLKVAPQTVSRWRNGKITPKAKMLNRIKREFKKVS